MKHIAPFAEITLLQIVVPDDFSTYLSNNHLFGSGDTSKNGGSGLALQMS